MSNRIYNSNLRLSAKTAILDSGTSLLALGKKDIIRIILIMNAFGNRCYFNVNKNLIFCFKNIFPTINFYLCDKEFSLEPKNYILSETVGYFLKITSINSDRPIAILGDVFLKKFYSYFDSDNHIIGIMKAARKGIATFNNTFAKIFNFNFFNIIFIFFLVIKFL